MRLVENMIYTFEAKEWVTESSSASGKTLHTVAISVVSSNLQNALAKAQRVYPDAEEYVVVAIQEMHK